MKEHEASDTREFLAAKKRDEHIIKVLTLVQNKLDPKHPDYINKNMEEKLNPISDNYDAAGKVGKWIMVLLLAISLISGTIWAIVQTIYTK